MTTAEERKELQFMANCHSIIPLWDEFKRQAIEAMLAEVDRLTIEEQAASEANYRFSADLIRAEERLAAVTAERDALAAELAKVKAAHTASLANANRWLDDVGNDCEALKAELARVQSVDGLLHDALSALENLTDAWSKQPQA